MTPFRRFLAKLAEKLAGTYYEGPDAPARLARLVEDFAAASPKATRGEWAEFSLRLAEEAYRTGYTRGFERAERSYDWRPDLPPEVLADMIDPTWKEDGRGISVAGAGRAVAAEPESDEDATRRHVEEVFLAGARRT